MSTAWFVEEATRIIARDVAQAAIGAEPDEQAVRRVVVRLARLLDGLNEIAPLRAALAEALDGWTRDTRGLQDCLASDKRIAEIRAKFLKP
jgi:hypothetical protein